MDEQTLRAAAEDHAKATVAGDFRTAGSYLNTDARGQAPAIMSAMPGPLTDCAVTSVEVTGDAAKVLISYTGETGTTTVESTWGEEDGKPVIVGLALA